MFIYICVRLI